MAINFNELRELLTAIAQNDITELTLKSADFELTVRKAGPVVTSSIDISNTIAGIAPQSPSMAMPLIATPPTEAASSTSTPQSPGADKKSIDVISPIVGTFYRSPSPDDPPFVEVGDRIRTSQTVCIIEAMKVMNEIEAEVSGQVIEILVQNGQTVEYGQPLMRINPDQ